MGCVCVHMHVQWFRADWYCNIIMLLLICTGHVNILVATDVASRGLDIKDITYVQLCISKYHAQ